MQLKEGKISATVNREKSNFNNYQHSFLSVCFNITLVYFLHKICDTLLKILLLILFIGNNQSTNISLCVHAYLVMSDTLQPHSSRQEYWCGLPLLSPGHLLVPRTEFTSPAAPALASGFFTSKSSGKPAYAVCLWSKILDSLDPIRSTQGCFSPLQLYHLLLEGGHQEHSVKKTRVGQPQGSPVHQHSNSWLDGQGHHSGIQRTPIQALIE